MLPFRKILFPVDYSEPCQAIVPYVKEMVRRFSADLTLVHAYGGDALAYSSLLPINPEMANEARAFEEQRLRDFAQRTFPGQHVETFAELGEAGWVVHNIVQHQGTDLVMLATHGRGPVRRFLLGSVTAKVLHDVGAAVWTGTGTALTNHAPRIPYKSVVCALDDSDEAEAVLRAAASFACEYQANLWLVQAIEMPPATLEIDFSIYRKDLADAADFGLRELKGRLNINAPHTVIDGTVADALREEVVRRQADLIITGRGRAQSTFGRMWSHVYPIVRESPCPVLSI
ncbi:MAG TPA: universal stress protein [Bryobacteraceae bacterium]|nr:universal stress protein [Bryobacteraceae bacterium]